MAISLSAEEMEITGPLSGVQQSGVVVGAESELDMLWFHQHTLAV